ncbi:DUF4214 domain-containing protein [Pseudomonas oryzihabitans]|uniref:DUF4214 domain-containing protein n=1 Tax=Pseudomonas oryzihabitans TaxID=47885 RepID=UPI0011A5B4FC
MATVANNAQVSALYAAVFGRAPDKAGLDFWTAQLDGGATLATTAAGFVGHPVFTQTYGSLTNIQFVNQVYQNVLGSSGDAKGVQFWVNKLANEGYSKAQFIAEFVQGALTIDLAAQLAAGALTQAEYDAAVTRQNTLTNKADVGVSFANTFGASSNLSASTDASSANVVNDAAYKAGAAAIASVTADKSTADAAKAAIADAAKTTDPVSSLSGSLANAGTGLKLAAFQAATKSQADLATSIATSVKDIASSPITSANEVNDANLKTLVDSSTTAYQNAQVNLNAANKTLADARVLQSDADVAKAAATAQANINVVSKALIDSSNKVVTDGVVTFTPASGSTPASTAVNASFFGSDDTAVLTAAQLSSVNTLLGATGAKTLASGTTVGTAKAAFTSDVTKALAADIVVAQAQNANAVAAKNLADDVAANGTDKVLADKIAANIKTLTAETGNKLLLKADGTLNTADATAQKVIDGYNAYVKGTVTATSFLDTVDTNATAIDSSNSSLKAQLASTKSLIDTRDSLNETAATAQTNSDTAAATVKEIAAQLQRDTDIKAITTSTDAITKAKAQLDLVTKAQSDYTAAEKVTADAKAALGTDVTVDTLDATDTGTISGVANKADIYVFDASNAKKDGAFTLSLENSIDKLFLGSNYVQGADITKGNNSALEFFVKNDGSGNAVVSVETTAFGSSAATQEVVSITLTGHSAADVHFASGFITTSAPATA